MKKAIFNGYKQKGHIFNFTAGNEYIVTQRFGHDYVTDDDGYDIPLIPHSYVYDFIIANEEYFIKEPAMVNCSAEEPAHLKYFINGNLVTKSYFYESIGELNEADKLGAKVSSVKFEIKFE